MTHPSARRPEEIEADIARTRTEIDATLSAIENRLTPGQLMERGLDYLRESGAREFASNLSGSVKHNPLPVTLVGIGLAWLMLADRAARRAPAEADDEPGALGERIDRMKASAASARQKMSDTAHAARERASQIGAGARHGWERARGGYDHMLREQPLALGAIGLAIGAAIAALVPRTRQEDELMGHASDRLAGQAKEAGREQLDKVQRVAAAAGSAASEEVRRHDLQGSESRRVEATDASVGTT